MAAPQPHAPVKPWPYAIRQNRNHEQQADPIKDLLGTRHIDAQCGQRRGECFSKSCQHESAENWPKQRAESAEDRRQDQFDRSIDTEHFFRKQIVVVESKKYAGE